MAMLKDKLGLYMGGVAVPLGLLVVALLGYFLLWPKYKDVMGARQAVATKKTFLQNRITQLQNIEALLVEYEKKKQQLIPIDQALPTAPRIPELLANLELLSKQSGLNITSLEITPAPSSNTPTPGQTVAEVKKTEDLRSSTENLNILQINIRMIGRYPNLRAWFSNLEQNLRLLDVQVVDIGESDDKNGGQGYTLKIYTYYQRDDE